MEYSITDNKQKSRYEIPLDGDYAVLMYKWEDDRLAVLHVIVPEAYEGKGIAGSLVKYMLEDMRSQHKKIEVYCPYTKAYLVRHPEYSDLVAAIH